MFLEFILLLTKNGTPCGTIPGEFGTKAFVIILIHSHLFKNLQVRDDKKPPKISLRRSATLSWKFSACPFRE